jgi:hypothetical protein
MLPARHSSASILLLLAEFCAFSGVGYSTSRTIRKQIIVVWLLYALVRGKFLVARKVGNKGCSWCLNCVKIQQRTQRWLFSQNG